MSLLYVPMDIAKGKKDGSSESSCEPQSPTVPEHSQVMGHNRWTPLDNYNKHYEEHLRLKTSQPQTKNHIHDNIVSHKCSPYCLQDNDYAQLKTKALAEASSWKTKRSRSLSDDPRLSRMYENVRIY